MLQVRRDIDGCDGGEADPRVPNLPQQQLSDVSPDLLGDLFGATAHLALHLLLVDELDGVALLEVVEPVEAQSALVPGGDLAHVVLEPSQR